MFSIQAPSLGERNRYGGHVVRIVSETTFGPTTDAENRLRSRLPGEFEIVTPGEGYGRVAYVVCESAEEEKEAAFAAVGERGVLEIVDKIRWFLAVHSCVYYDHGKTVCSDSTWDRKARELAKLQDVFGADVGSWENETFDGFSGDTGYHLPRTGAVKREARSVIEQAEEEDDE